MAVQRVFVEQDDDGDWEWAHVAWAQIHARSDGMPDWPTKEEDHAFQNWLWDMADSLQCQDPCGKEMRKYLRANLPYLQYHNRGASRWGVDFHNHVNQRLGKPLLPYEEYVMRQKYFSYDSFGERKLQQQVVAKVSWAPSHSSSVWLGQSTSSNLSGSQSAAGGLYWGVPQGSAGSHSVGFPLGSTQQESSAQAISVPNPNSDAKRSQWSSQTIDLVGAGAILALVGLVVYTLTKPRRRNSDLDEELLE